MLNCQNKKADTAEEEKEKKYARKESCESQNSNCIEEIVCGLDVVSLVFADNLVQPNSGLHLFGPSLRV